MRRGKHRRNNRDTAGMTLIELMISVLLAGILVGGLFYMMAGQDRTYTSQVRLLTAQQNMWSAMEYIQGEVRKAGFGFTGCGGEIRTFVALDAGATGDGGIPTMTLVAMEIRNNLNLFTGVADGTDSLSMRYVDPNDPTAPFGMGIRVTHGVPKKTGVIGSEHFYLSNATGISKDDLLVICAPGADYGYVLQVTADPKQKNQDNDGDGVDDWMVDHSSKNNPYNPPFGKLKDVLPPGGFPEGSTVVKLGNINDVHHYAIDNTRDPPMLVTWMGTDKTTREVIAAGIEDMQVSWACRAAVPETGPTADSDWDFVEGACKDGNGDGKCVCCVDTSIPPDNTCDDYPDGNDACDLRKTDEWANNTPGDTNPDCTNKSIAMVRITLGARTTSGVVGDRTGFRPGSEDRPTGTPAQDLAKTSNVGTYARATLTAKVQPRNIRQKN
jgi:hypothetical protein